MSVTRRYFLKSGGIAAATLAAAPSFLVRTAFAQTNANHSVDDPILIAIFQRGAADGISMVVPFGDKHYSSARPQIAIPEPSRAADESAIDLDGFFGLHPALDSLKPIYDAGHLAVVHAAGSPDSTRSHFDAQDYMESGAPGNKSAADGWLNRYLQTGSANAMTPFRAVAIEATLPRSLAGSAPTLAIERIADFGLHGGAATPELEAIFADSYKDTFDAVKMLRSVNPQQYSPAVSYPNSQFGQALLQIAQLVKSNIGLQVAFVDIGGWDTHANQGSGRGARQSFERIWKRHRRPVSRPRRSHAQCRHSHDDGVRPRRSAKRFRRHRPRARQFAVCGRRAGERRESLRPMAGSCSRTTPRRPRPCVDDRLSHGLFGDSDRPHGRQRRHQDFSGFQENRFAADRVVILQTVRQAAIPSLTPLSYSEWRTPEVTFEQTVCRQYSLHENRRRPGGMVRLARYRTRAVEIIQDRVTSKPRGFGFVELEDDTLAETAVRALNGKLFAGRALTISWATPIRESA